MKLRNNNNPVLRKYFKDYCRILSKVIKEAKRMEYDRYILNSNNVKRTSWKLINKELGKDHKNHGFQSPMLMVGVLQIIKLLPMPLINTLQLSLL